MKKLIAFLTSLSVAGCASGSNIAPDVTAFENGVIADVEALCQVEPTLASVGALFGIYGTAVGAAARAVCAAVNAAPQPPVSALAMGVDSNTGKAVRHNFPPVVVRGHTIYFQ